MAEPPEVDLDRRTGAMPLGLPPQRRPAHAGPGGQDAPGRIVGPGAVEPAESPTAARRLARRPRLQHAAEWVLGLPAGSLVDIECARMMRAVRLDAEAAIRARDRQIADLRRFLIKNGYMEDYWREVVNAAAGVAKARVSDDDRPGA